MPSGTVRMRFAARAASLAVAATALVVRTTAEASGAQADPSGPPVIYREPDDPIVGVLGRADRRIFSDDPTDYSAEASARGLRELDLAIAARPEDPRLHWYRHLTLDRMKRTAEARAAREEAIRLARVVPGGADLLPEYYREHAVACGKEGDPAAAAAALLAWLDLRPASGLYQSVVIWLGDQPRGDPRAPGPGPLFPGRERLEALWGPLERFFESHGGTDRCQSPQTSRRAGPRGHGLSRGRPQSRVRQLQHGRLSLGPRHSGHGRLLVVPDRGAEGRPPGEPDRGDPARETNDRPRRNR